MGEGVKSGTPDEMEGRDKRALLLHGLKFFTQFSSLNQN